MRDLEKQSRYQKEYYSRNRERINNHNKENYKRRCKGNYVPRKFTFIDYVRYLLAEDKKLNA